MDVDFQTVGEWVAGISAAGKSGSPSVPTAAALEAIERNFIAAMRAGVEPAGASSTARTLSPTS